MVYVFVDHFVDLAPKLLSDFGFAWFHQLPHHTHDILTALGSCIGDIEVMEREREKERERLEAERRMQSEEGEWNEVTLPPIVVNEAKIILHKILLYYVKKCFS